MPTRVNVRWLLTVLIALPLLVIIIPWWLEPAPEPRPTLVGMTATDNGVITPITLDGREIARTKVPEDATARPALWLQGNLIWAIPLTPGITVNDEPDRIDTAILLVHTEFPRLGAPVTRRIAGQPAVELAYGNTADTWFGVATIVFAPTGIIAVNCHRTDLAPCATALADMVIS